MDLDAECLRDAKIENVERLAMALKVRIPARKRHDRKAYARELIRAVVLGIRQDKARAAIELRRRS